MELAKTQMGITRTRRFMFFSLDKNGTTQHNKCSIERERGDLFSSSFEFVWAVPGGRSIGYLCFSLSLLVSFFLLRCAIWDKTLVRRQVRKVILLYSRKEREAKKNAQESCGSY